MFCAKRSDLHQGHAHISPLEGRQQEVWPHVPESCRCPCLRPRRAKGLGGHHGRFHDFLFNAPERDRAGRRRRIHKRHRQLLQLLPEEGAVHTASGHLHPVRTAPPPPGAPPPRALQDLGPLLPGPGGSPVPAPRQFRGRGGGGRADQPSRARLADGLRGLPTRGGPRPLPPGRRGGLVRAPGQERAVQARLQLPVRGRLRAGPQGGAGRGRRGRGRHAASPPQGQAASGGGGRALALRVLPGRFQPRGEPPRPVPLRSRPGQDVHPPSQLHVVRRQPPLPLHVGPGGRLFGPVLVRHRRRALLPALAGPAGPVGAGSLPVLLPATTRLSPVRGGVRLLRGQTQGRRLTGCRCTYMRPLLVERKAKTYKEVLCGVGGGFPSTPTFLFCQSHLFQMDKTKKNGAFNWLENSFSLYTCVRVRVCMCVLACVCLFVCVTV